MDKEIFDMIRSLAYVLFGGVMGYVLGAIHGHEDKHCKCKDEDAKECIKGEMGTTIGKTISTIRQREINKDLIKETEDELRAKLLSKIEEEQEAKYQEAKQSWERVVSNLEATEDEYKDLPKTSLEMNTQMVHARQEANVATEVQEEDPVIVNTKRTVPPSVKQLTDTQNKIDEMVSNLSSKNPIKKITIEDLRYKTVELQHRQSEDNLEAAEKLGLLKFCKEYKLSANMVAVLLYLYSSYEMTNNVKDVVTNRRTYTSLYNKGMLETSTDDSKPYSLTPVIFNELERLIIGKIM